MKIDTQALKELIAEKIAAVTVTITFRGSDFWDTGSGSVTRTFDGEVQDEGGGQA